MHFEKILFACKKASKRLFLAAILLFVTIIFIVSFVPHSESGQCAVSFAIGIAGSMLATFLTHVVDIYINCDDEQIELADLVDDFVIFADEKISNEHDMVTYRYELLKRYGEIKRKSKTSLYKKELEKHIFSAVFDVVRDAYSGAGYESFEAHLEKLNASIAELNENS